MKKSLITLMLGCLVAVALAVPAASAEKRASPRPRELSGVVNVNTATVQEIASLPGVGESLALRIVERRMKSPFRKPGDLMSVKGVGKKKYEGFSRYVTVSGKTTLQAAPNVNDGRAHSHGTRGDGAGKVVESPQAPKALMAPAVLDTIAYV